MSVAGIVCEYNPMHTGHIYHIGKTKESASDGVVCCMSGNYVQRGEPAFLDKWTRAEIAVINGADLVIEIPSPWSLDSAENFAKAGVFLLDRIGCDVLSFGAESFDQKTIDDILSVSDLPSFSASLSSYIKSGYPYPSAFSKAVDHNLGCRVSDFISRPNNLLALEYCKAIRYYDSSMQVLAVDRVDSDHTSKTTEGEYISSTAIRTSESLKYLSSYLADGVTDKIDELSEKNRFPIKTSAAEKAVLYSVSLLSKDETENYCGDKELAGRLFSAFKKASTYEELIRFSKTKAYTEAKIRRSLMRCFLKIPAHLSKENVPYIHALAANGKGLSILSDASKSSDLSIVTKHSERRMLSGFGREVYDIECSASEAYGCFAPKFVYRGSEQKHSIKVMKK